MIERVTVTLPEDLLRDSPAKRSFALIDHLRSIDKRRVRRVFGELTAGEILAIDEGLTAFLGLENRLRRPGGQPVQ